MRPGVLTSVQQAQLLSDKSGLQYITDRPNTEVSWIGGYGLGGGSYGEVTLWVCVDRKTRKPIDQCAIKDAFDNRSTKEKGLYRNRNIYQTLVAKGLDFGVDPWSNFLGQADVESRFYKEAYLQGIMTVPNSTDQVYTVPLWGFSRKGQSLRPDYNHWRLYMPLYPYGDMFDLIRDHSVQKKAIPEPFIWHTLHCLMLASVQLYELPRQLDGATDSDVIVVFDMKPDNILLAPPNQNSAFPIYPVPHIADLGGGCLTNNHDPYNTVGKLDCQMTEGYYPPEYIKPSLYVEGRVPCGPWTNIWQIGRVAEALMKLATVFDNFPYQTADSMEELEPDIMTWRGGLPGQDYSHELRKVVFTCMRFNPYKRATTRRVIDLIESNSTFQFYMRGMHTFGNDAWFAGQERKQAAKAAAQPPATTTPPTPKTAAAQEAAASKKRKRMEDANHYLRAWDADKRARFVKLGVLPDERYDIIYRDNQFWATDDSPVMEEDGKLVKDVKWAGAKGMVWMKGHTASVDFGDLKIASSAPAVGGDDNDGGDGEVGSAGGFHYDSADFPDLGIPSPPGEAADADDLGEGNDDDNHKLHSSDIPWIANLFGEGEDDVDGEQEEVDVEEEVDDGGHDSGSLYHSAPSEVWHSMSTHGPENPGDQEEDDGDDL